MKYVKISLVVVAVFLLAILLTVVVRVVREVIVSGAGALHELGNAPLEETAEPGLPAPETGAEDDEPVAGYIDPNLEFVPGATNGNVVYDTGDKDLFDVPVDEEADQLAPDAG